MSLGPIDRRPPESPPRQANLVPLMVAVIPAGCWPFVLVPNLMSLAGHQPTDASAPGPLVVAASNVFLWGSTAYPLVYFAALAASLALAFVADRHAAASVVAWVPLAYLAVVVGCLVVWLCVAT